MTDAGYQIVKKVLLKKKAELKASPAAAKKFLIASGLEDILASAPEQKNGKAVAAKKNSNKKVSS